MNIRIMADGALTVDSLLASLVGMGFELDRCQAAVNCGKLSIHEAVEWLLQGHGAEEEKIPMRSAPTLSLNQQPQARPTAQATDASHLPFSLPPVTPPPSQLKDSHSPASLTASPSDESKFQQQDVVSRFSLSEKKRQEKDRWEREQREKAAVEARQARLQAKQARSNILKNIEADKEARHQLGKLPTSPDKSTHQQETSMEAAPSVQSSSATSAPAGGVAKETPQQASGSQGPQTTQSTPAMCTLQFRFPSGQSAREKFSPSATLQSVVDFIKSKHAELTCIDLIQPFPHRLFTLADLGSTLQELKLTPNGNLVVKLATHEPPAPQREAHDVLNPLAASPDQDNQPQPPEQQGPPPSQEEFLHHAPLPLDVPLPFQASSSSYRWGRGHALNPDDDAPSSAVEEEEPMEVGGAGASHDDAGGALDEMGGEDEAGIGGAEEEMLWAVAPPHRHQMDGRQHHDWGDGNRLIDGRRPLNFNYGFGQPQERPDGEEVPSPERAAAAALSRLAAAGPVQAKSPASTADKPITALQDLCLRCVSKRIEGRTRQPLTVLEALPLHIASRLVDELKKSGSLRPKTLQLFLPCRLQCLTLDCYKYTTNELLQAARLHVHISKLSLSACPLLTDQAFLSINSLKRLQYLNVSNNRQLTDGIMHSVKDSSNMVTLVLEGTSVSDEGIRILTSSVMSQLTHLSLNRTNVSDKMLPFLAGFLNLKSLGVEQTKVSQLKGIESLASLHSLNIARNGITPQALDRLGQLPELTAVNVMLLGDMMGDEVLRHLRGLELKQLQMPDRHTTTDGGLCYIAGMPLVALDLSDYIHITDQGIHHIADMTSLTKLSLNNTKITDVALSYIQGLVGLKELHVDRTAITDHGAMAIGNFRKLEVLSMAATQIKNKFLCSKTLEMCQHLTRLNLSRTDVSDRGIGALRLPQLTLLNLDSTYVTMEGASSMHGCPNLKLVRTNNLRFNRGDEDDD